MDVRTTVQTQIVTGKVEKRALISGVTGQDGSYLAELLLEKGYDVHGIVRQRSNRKLIAHIDRLHLHTGDVTDQASLDAIMATVQPHEIYHLAAQSFVAASWAIPEMTLDVTGLGTLRMLEAMRKWAPTARLYQAGSSEQFGAAPAPQSETTPFHPRSPYGCAKVLAHDLVRNYRESYGLYAVTGICFNHEGPRRGPEFVTRKITIAVARIKQGLQEALPLGTLSAQRDWGHAREYVEAMWGMLQPGIHAPRPPTDYVIATGELYSVKDFVVRAFAAADLDWEDHVVHDEALMRPAEVWKLQGDATKIREELGWQPAVSFDDLVKEMVEHDLRLIAEGRTP